MLRILIAAAVVCVASYPCNAQQRQATMSIDSAADPESLQAATVRRYTPVRTARIAAVENVRVTTGDESTETIREIVTRSFAEQAEFAAQLSRTALVNAGAIVAPAVTEDEVVETDEAYIIRRSTRVIVRDPAAVAQASTLFRDYIAVSETPAPNTQLAANVSLSAEEQSGLRNFIANEVPSLHPDDPLRQAASQGESAVLEAIAAGKGEFLIEDTLVIPKTVGTLPGQRIEIPTIRDGVMDFQDRQPARLLDARPKTLEAAPIKPGAITRMRASPTPAPKPPPSRAPLEPRAEASGKADITAEFLLGWTRTANFQYERKWSFPSGFFRITLGAGYGFGYRIPVEARASIEPTRGFIQDYADKTMTAVADARVRTVDGNAAYFERAGLSGPEVQNGRELLLEAYVGWGYKLRALWKTLAHRPYQAIGVDLSQSFRPPTAGLDTKKDFALLLEPSKTKISIDRWFFGGSATMKFMGGAWGDLSMDVDTLVDDQRQNTYTIKPGQNGGSGHPYKITLDAMPVTEDMSTRTRPYGIRFDAPEYRGRIKIVPALQLAFRLGYKRLSLNFKTPWIPLNSLKVDTGTMTLGPHAGTRGDFTWNEGEKIFRPIRKPVQDPSKTLNQAIPVKPARQRLQND